MHRPRTSIKFVRLLTTILVLSTLLTGCFFGGEEEVAESAHPLTGMDPIQSTQRFHQALAEADYEVVLACIHPTDIINNIDRFDSRSDFEQYLADALTQVQAAVTSARSEDWQDTAQYTLLETDTYQFPQGTFQTATVQSIHQGADGSSITGLIDLYHTDGQWWVKDFLDLNP